MAIVAAPPIIAPPAPSPARRDASVDLLRAVCVTGVVLLHAIMVGVTVRDGAPVFENASDGSWWIIPVSWALQVMPLFFIIGGFAGFHAFRRLRERGGTATDFVAGRVHRLLRPAIVVVGAVGALLALLAVIGVPGDLIAVAGFRYSQPLWFLGVFLLCQALLPALTAAHERRPVLTLAALASAALVVDAVRLHTGIEVIGFLNLAFVWCTLQQLGFFLADGTIDRLPRRTRAVVGAAALLLLLASFALGVYSPDLVANINPPTGALLLVGLVHLSAVSLFRDRLTAWSRRPGVAAFTSFVNRRTMTIYLWHMPVLLAMAGLSALAAVGGVISLAEPSTLLWWAERPLWLVTALTLTALLSVALTGVELRPTPTATASAWRVVLAVFTGITVVAMLLVVGTSVWTAALAAVALYLAVRLCQRSRQSSSDERVAHVVGMS